MRRCGVRVRRMLAGRVVADDVRYVRRQWSAAGGRVPRRS